MKKEKIKKLLDKVEKMSIKDIDQREMFGSIVVIINGINVFLHVTGIMSISGIEVELDDGEKNRVAKIVRKKCKELDKFNIDRREKEQSDLLNKVLK